IITAAVLKLFPRPRVSVTALAAVRDARSAVRLLRALRRSLGDRLTGFELISAVCKELVLRHIPRARDVLPGHAWYCLVQVDDVVPDSGLRARLEGALGEAVESGVVDDAIVAQSLAQAEELWGLRENISEAQ